MSPASSAPAVRWPATSKKSVWGPALWIYLHTAATFCEDPAAFTSLMLSLIGTLPCAECRKHLKTYMARTPPTSIVDAESALSYVQSLHDHVDSLSKGQQQPVAPTTTALAVVAPPPAAARRRVPTAYEREMAVSSFRHRLAAAQLPTLRRGATTAPAITHPHTTRFVFAGSSSAAAPRLRRLVL